mgnify:CR=1 FL=1
MGRRARPVELLVLNGKKHLTKDEIQKRKEGEARLRPAADAVRAPSWLDKEAKKIWRRAVKALGPLEILTNADVDQLALFCDAAARYAECSRLIQEQGIIIETERGPMQNPAVAAQSKYASIVARLGGKFGLDPSGRASIAIPKGDDKPRDKFEELFGS